MSLQGNLFIRLAVCGAIIVALAGAASGENEKGNEKKTEAPKFEPGKAVSIEIKGTKHTDEKDSKWIIYLPTNYDKSRSWPVFFCFHGLNGAATTFPIQGLAKGKHYIVIGCPYYERGLEGYDQFSKDVANLKVVLKFISSKFNINRKMIFAGGFSKGGYYTCNMLCALPKLWSGGMILGGGWGTKGVSNSKALRGKPIFIGCGTADEHFGTAEKANTTFRQLGADVIFERWKDVGHTMPEDISLMQKWILFQGPLRNAKSDMASAAKLKKSKPGKALAICSYIAGVDETEEICKKAAKVAKELTEQAEREAEEADKLLAEKKYVKTAKALAKLSQRYAGSVFGGQADAKLKKLKSDKNIRGIIEKVELNAKADALEVRARGAEEKKKYAKAIRLYEFYVKNYAVAENYAKVKKHLAQLKADNKPMASKEDEKAAKQCKKWLCLADNYIRARMYDKATRYLNKIIENHKGTKWAEEAAKRLDKIKAAGG